MQDHSEMGVTIRMRPTLLKTTPWILAILFLTAAPLAEAKARYVEERAYVGAFGLFAGLSNDANYGFAGDGAFIYLENENYRDYELTPKMKTNYGFGGLVGYRRGDYALEVSYWRSEHKSEFLDYYEDKALFQSFNLDLKRFLFTYFPVQPYLSFGMSFPWVVFKNAGNVYVLEGDTPGYLLFLARDPKDVSYSGIGFNLGVGFELFATRTVSLTGGAVQRWAGYSSSKGADNEPKELANSVMIPTSLRDSSIGFHFGATINFM